MKFHCTLPLLGLLAASTAVAQTEPIITEPIRVEEPVQVEETITVEPMRVQEPMHGEPLTIVEEMPSFPGGQEELMKHIGKELKYPAEAVENGIEGTVFIAFVVEPDGMITEVKVLRGIGGGCNEEAVRVVKGMPKWIPGKQRGKAVRVKYNLPIRFKLQAPAPSEK